MKDILKQVYEWLQEAEDDVSDSMDAFPEAFHRGEVAAYTQVRVLLQQSIIQQANIADP